MMSEPPPAPNELMIFTVCVGYSCDVAGETSPAAKRQAASVKVRLFIVFLPLAGTILRPVGGVKGQCQVLARLFGMLGLCKG